MLTWCSFCQQFQGERPPFENLAITHGICPRCEETALDLTERDLVHTRTLQAVQGRFWKAGRSGDLKAVEDILADAINANVRPPDILMGIVAPMLWQIGEDWKRGVLTVADEHRFTAFCEAVFESVVATVKVSSPDRTIRAGHPFLLMNAGGNRHTLAIHMLELWLKTKGVPTLLVAPCPTAEDLVALITKTLPAAVLMSMALAEQRPSIVALTERIDGLPQSMRPKIIVGGYAVKAGLVPPIPTAELMPDINRLFESPSREWQIGLA